MGRSGTRSRSASSSVEVVLEAVLVVPLLVLGRVGLVDEADPQAPAEHRLGAQRVLEPRHADLVGVEVPGVGPEADGGAGVALSDLADDLQFGALLAAGEGHRVLVAVAAHPHLQALRQGVDHRHADAVQTAREAVVLGPELGAGVEAGEDHLDPRHPLLGVDVHRHAAAVVGHRRRAVGVEGDVDLGAVAGDRLVDAVVDHLEHQVVGALGLGVHPRTLAHRLEPGEDFDGGGVVGHRRGGGWAGAPPARQAA